MTALATTTMGPLPASAGCTCQICLPRRPTEPPYDEHERSCIETVYHHGWQVMAVGGDGPCRCCGVDARSAGGPTFAYTLGLRHRAGHPELAMMGLPTAVMHRALNVVAERVVLHGDTIRPGDIIETALDNAPVAVERVSPRGLRHIGTWSSWFHRHPVEALLLVWPTVSGVFPWQPGAPADLTELQPPSWRGRVRRTGALAVDPPWPFPVAPDEMVIVCTHVREQGEPVRFVARRRDGGNEMWDVHCGRDHGGGIEQLLLEHFAHTVRATPSLREVAGLAVGEYAERADAFSPWRRLPIVPFGDERSA